MSLFIPLQLQMMEDLLLPKLCNHTKMLLGNSKSWLVHEDENSSHKVVQD